MSSRQSPYDLVRVQCPDTGAQFTTTRAAANGAGAKVLDKDAVDHAGKPLPAKPRTTKAGQSPAPRDTKKES